MSLFENRPGANASAIELLDFSLARFIRIRLQGMHMTLQSSENNVQWLVDRTELNKRSFYSLQNIKIGARLECGGHANRVKPMMSGGGAGADDDVCSAIFFKVLK